MLLHTYCAKNYAGIINSAITAGSVNGAGAISLNIPEVVITFKKLPWSLIIPQPYSGWQIQGGRNLLFGGETIFLYLDILALFTAHSIKTDWLVT